MNINKISRINILNRLNSPPSGILPSSWIIVSDGLIWYRKGIRSGNYVIDYSSDGGITWKLNIVVLEPDEDSIIIAIDDGEVDYRHLVRSGDYVIDHALTPLGFEVGSVEGVDWENVYSTATI